LAPRKAVEKMLFSTAGWAEPVSISFPAVEKERLAAAGALTKDSAFGLQVWPVPFPSIAVIGGRI
jgi:hypothetical protein